MEIVLRAWSGTSVALLVIGMVLWLQAPRGDGADLALGTGLVLLMATPVVKLVSVLLDEVRARDWRFVMLGLLVLALLAGSVALGALGP
jgi:hypothetical protein